MRFFSVLLDDYIMNPYIFVIQHAEYKKYIIKTDNTHINTTHIEQQEENNTYIIIINVFELKHV